MFSGALLTATHAGLGVWDSRTPTVYLNLLGHVIDLSGNFRQYLCDGGLAENADGQAIPLSEFLDRCYCGPPPEPDPNPMHPKEFLDIIFRKGKSIQYKRNNECVSCMQ